MTDLLTAFRSRYHGDRVHQMGRGQSPRCRQILSLPPQIESTHAVFPFEVDGWRHHRTVTWGTPSANLASWLPSFAIGIAAAETYRLAEICFPQTIEFPWHGCSDWESEWWNEDVRWYLQQKIFLEGWSFAEMPRMRFSKGSVEHPASWPEIRDSYLLAVSGGKESTFAFEWFQRAQLPTEMFTLHFAGRNESPDWQLKFPVFGPMQTSAVFHELTASQEADPADHFAYQGVRNDPTITNALFLMMGIAAAQGHRYLALASDKSANEGNALHEGQVINHQSAKGSEYIVHFNKYLAHRKLPFQYVSACEHVYSLGATMQLAKWRPEWLALLCSCNEAQWMPGTERWCRRCPKCLFSYALIEAGTNRTDAIRTVGEDLLLVPELQPMWQNLIRPDETKAFECVGTRGETATALHLLWQGRMQRGEPVGFLGELDVISVAPEFLDGAPPSGIPDDHRARLRAVLGPLHMAR